MMLKSLIKVLFVIAVVIVSVIPVGAVNEPTAPTEIETEIVIQQVTEQLTEITTEIATEQVTDVVYYIEEEHIKNVYAGFYIVIFGVANLVGIKLAQSFSFWKW